MNLVQVLCIVLTEISVGSLLLTCLLPPREVRISFFTFMSLLCALTAAVALMLSKGLLLYAWADVRFLGLTVIGATAAYGAFRLDKPDIGRILLLISGLIGFVLGLLPLVAQTLLARGIDTTAPGFFDASAVSGTLLLGATTVGLVLGHWYLLMRRLSFEYLLLFARIVLGAIVLRALVMLGTLSSLSSFDPRVAAAFLPPLWSPQGNLFFLLMRVLWGLVLPSVLGFMVLRCAMEKDNQPATGLLYVMEICVLFGELFAAYLLI